MDWLNHRQWGVVIVASLAAALCDARTGRIPNWLAVTVAALGLLWAGEGAGWVGFAESMMAWFVLALPFVVLFVFAHGGAGDAKMMGAIGALLGLKQGLIVLCCVAIMGAVLAALRIIAHRQRRSLLSDAMAMAYVCLAVVAGGLGGLRLPRTNADERTGGGLRRLTIPYGVAIFLGTCIGRIVVLAWNP
jgi:prepilin peptidase CpaA